MLLGTVQSTWVCFVLFILSSWSIAKPVYWSWRESRCSKICLNNDLRDFPARVSEAPRITYTLTNTSPCQIIVYKYIWKGLLQATGTGHFPCTHVGFHNERENCFSFRQIGCISLRILRVMKIVYVFISAKLTRLRGISGARVYWVSTFFLIWQRL